MNYIVLDMEWNQPYSKNKKTVGGIELAGEIIQFGAVKLDSSLKPRGKFEANVKPRFYKKLNRHVKNITGLEDDNLRGGGSFVDVYNEFCRFCGDNYKFMTWGGDDMPMLRSNLTAYGIDVSKLPQNINLQTLFGAQVAHDGKQWSLSDAMERLNIKQTLRSHDALSDAVNTASIAKKLDIKKFSKAESGFFDKGSVENTVEGYKNLKELFCDKRNYKLRCPVCKKKLKKTRWVASRYKRYTVADCPAHGAFKFTLTASPSDNGCVAHRRVIFASHDAIERYNEKIIGL